MSLLDEYRDSLHKVGDGTVNPLEQERKRLTYSQMKIYYIPQTVILPKLPKKTEVFGALPDSILSLRLSSRIRRLLFDLDNRWAWNRISRARANEEKEGEVDE